MEKKLKNKLKNIEKNDYFVSFSFTEWILGPEI